MGKRLYQTIIASVILLSIFFGSHFNALAEEESNEPIRVRLNSETQAKRLPVYITSFICEDTNFDKNYCNNLEKILRFDFNHNGTTQVIPVSSENERRSYASEFEVNLKESDWKALRAYYVAKIIIKEGQMSARLFSANADNVRSIDGLPLNGNFANDRQRIHQLSDIIHKALFNQEGIASTHFLYTLKSPQGKKWSSEVWEADYDGGNARQLTFDSGYIVNPIYMPPKFGYSSGSFFFVSYKTGQPKIYYQSLLENDKPHRLSLLRGNQLMPAISPKRDKIAFISDVTGNPDLFIQQFNPEEGPIGKPYQIFATHRATQGTPTFNPEGTKLAFVSNKDGSPRIYMMDVPPAGTSLTNIKATLITKRNKESTAPAWSPDGNKIAYCAITNGVRQIWVYDMASKEEKQITQGPGNKENPCWAPNSLHLIFNSTDAGACEMYLVNLNQPDTIQISFGNGEKRFPCWQPRR